MKRVDFAPISQDLQAVAPASRSRLTHSRDDTLRVRHDPPLWFAEFTHTPPRRQRFPPEFHATLPDSSTVSARMRRPVSHHLPARVHNMAVQAIKTRQRQEVTMHSLHGLITVHYSAWSQTPRGTDPDLRVEAADGQVQGFEVTQLGSEGVTWRVACRPERRLVWMPPVLWRDLPNEVVLHVFTHVMNDGAGPEGDNAVGAAEALAQLRPVDRRANRLALATAQCLSHQAVALVESDAAIEALIDDDTVSPGELPGRLDVLLSQRWHVEVSLQDIRGAAHRVAVLQALGRCSHLQTLVIRMLDRGNSLSAELAMLPAIAAANSRLDRFTLDLGHCRLQANDVALLMTLPLTALDVSRTGLPSAAAAMLTTHAHLEELDLSGNRLDRQACALAHATVKLHSLNLADNRITDAGVQDLSRSRSLRVLVLTNNALTHQCAPALAAMQLFELDLSRNPLLGDDGLQALSGSMSLRHLSVNDCGFGTDGLRALTRCRSLRQLNVEMNRLDDTALEVLGTMPLTGLDAAGNDFTGRGLVALAGHRDCTIELLDLSGNYITTPGATFLAGGLPALRHLALQANLIPGADHQAVVDAFGRRSPPIVPQL